MGLVSLLEESRELHVRVNVCVRVPCGKKMAICEPRRSPHGTLAVRHLDLGPPSFQNCEKQRCSLSHPVCGILL